MCDANCPCSKHGRTLDFPRRMTRASRIERLDYLKDQLRNRVVILDGAMGTNIQKFRLEEEDYRGECFADAARYPNDLKNNNDLLVLTRPEIILDIHRRFLDTGRADILETYLA